MRWWLAVAFASVSARAFPPAPYYTLFGLVRDQVGATLKVDGAELILLKDGKEIGRASGVERPARRFQLRAQDQR